jgi:ATP-dependent 26S proteasome regulatory subunit
MQPLFWTKVAKAFKETVAHAFALHGPGVNDYADGEVDVLPWLDSVLVQAQFDLVIHYDLAQGITLALPQQKKLLADLLGLAGPAPTGPRPPLPPQLQAFAPQAAQASAGADEVTLPRDPGQALPFLSRTLDLANQGRKVALIFPYAADLFPATGFAVAASLPDRVNLEFALNWARNPTWRGSATAPLIFFLAPSLTALAGSLAETVYPVEVQAPEYDGRLAFITERLNENPDVQLAEGMTSQRFAALTAGLLKVHIMDVIVQSRLNDTPLTAEQITARKTEIMSATYAGVLETEEATGSLADVAGLDYLTRFLVDEVVEPMKAGDTTGVPMGILLAGPPGTGKSYLAKKLAAAAGINFVNFRMSQILGGIVGQSEGNLERALQGIRSLTPCIVFVDEIDQAFRRSEGADGSSVNRNLFGRLLNFMADTTHRGKVLWLAATNRPDLLDAAILRSGRFDAIVAVLPPDTVEARAQMFQTMARKNAVSLDDTVDPTSAALAAEGYTGADIERIVLKALSVARKAGRDTVSGMDLVHALRSIRINTKDRDSQIATALAVVNDLDLLPPTYRELAEAQAATESAAVPAPAVPLPPTRQARSL